MSRVTRPTRRIRQLIAPAASAGSAPITEAATMVHSAGRSTPPTVTSPVAMTDLTGANASTDPITLASAFTAFTAAVLSARKMLEDQPEARPRRQRHDSDDSDVLRQRGAADHHTTEVS